MHFLNKNFRGKKCLCPLMHIVSHTEKVNDFYLLSTTETGYRHPSYALWFGEGFNKQV